ncbi:sulfate permease, SulP family [Galdieria sulphuraria]|uniref:Sulfate permease, SulP family n=1 Tax=Galdieria sulphuraria TaxID=130081 RepID=M2XG26_GALSU|nr:sulfate permease, SulP family [Galdieria sulphuraria]EME28987.1 sulfate permease, SulP family [Galdieria sulphuraria]|eukprot:XP_005705507.1 sulfate permease, SulP family [Galdieria sulphuraria]
MQKNSDSEANQTLPAFRGTFGAVLRSIFPSLKWFSSYDWFQFITDVFAGLTVGLVCSVQGLSYSLLARLPQSVGFHFAVPMFVEALLSSSRNLIGGPVALVSLSVGQSIAPETTSSTALELASIYSIFVGMVLILLGLLGGGHFANYISRTVILGFTSAVSIVIICNELGALLGISVIQSAYAWKVASFVFQNVSQLKIPTTMLSICVLMYFYVSKHYFSLYLQRFWQSIHSSIWYSFLMVGILVAMTLLNSATHFSSTFGMEVVGSVPQAFPKFRWPRMEMIREAFRIRTIATLTLLVLIESTSIALSLASKQHYKVNLNREVTSLGLANLFGGWVQCYPFAASFSRSAVNANAGAKTPVAQMIAALFLAFASWGLAEFLRYVPKCLLASVICISVSGLIEWEEWMRLLYLDAWELAIFTASFLAPLLLGSVWGLAFAIFTSYVPILFQLWRMLDVVDMRNKDWWRCCFRVSKEEQQHVIRLPKLLFFGNALSLVRCIEEELENVYMETDDFVALDASLVVYMDTISLDSLENWLQSDEKAKNRCIIRNLPSSLMTRVYDGRKLHKLINILVQAPNEYEELLEA